MDIENFRNETYSFHGVIPQTIIHLYKNYKCYECYTTMLNSNRVNRCVICHHVFRSHRFNGVHVCPPSSEEDDERPLYCMSIHTCPTDGILLHRRPYPESTT